MLMLCLSSQGRIGDCCGKVHQAANGLENDELGNDSQMRVKTTLNDGTVSCVLCLLMYPTGETIRGCGGRDTHRAARTVRIGLCGQARR
jgi:hypothetical protein